MSDNFSVPQAGMQARLGPGSRIAGYVIEEQVGAGGMAVVFRARDEALGRLAALKVMSPSLSADGEFRSRFERERRLLASLDEPHILPVYSAGEAGGVLYIATRFVASGDLADLLHANGGPLDSERAASLIAQVGAALDAVHAVGLLHRDVKPANVLIDRTPARGEHAYLSDFGLSRAASSATGLTGSGVFMGTPDYCPPEQVTGKPPASARSDQYALACLAFTLLTGSAPYQREDALAVIVAHAQAPIPALTALRPELPEPVDAVVAKAMAKAPDERYESCGLFAAALHAALAPAARKAPDMRGADAPKNTAQVPPPQDTVTVTRDAQAQPRAAIPAQARSDRTAATTPKPADTRPRTELAAGVRAAGNANSTDHETLAAVRRTAPSAGRDAQPAVLIRLDMVVQVVTIVAGILALIGANILKQTGSETWSGSSPVTWAILIPLLVAAVGVIGTATATLWLRKPVSRLPYLQLVLWLIVLADSLYVYAVGHRYFDPYKGLAVCDIPAGAAVVLLLISTVSSRRRPGSSSGKTTFSTVG
jgi:serine/threonine-protein kinase